MTCFSSSEEKPVIEILNNRVELRLSKPFNEERPRINCTMPFIDEKGSEPRFRWLGLLYTIPASLLSDAKKYPVEHAQDSNDEFSVE